MDTVTVPGDHKNISDMRAISARQTTEDLLGLNLQVSLQSLMKLMINEEFR